VVISRADLEYRPRLPSLLEPIEQDAADVVTAAGWWRPAPPRPFFCTIWATGVTSCPTVHQPNLSDMEVGYKVFKAEVLKGSTSRRPLRGGARTYRQDRQKGWRTTSAIQYHAGLRAGKKITCGTASPPSITSPI